MEAGAAYELIAAHLEGPVAAQPYVQAVEYDPELRRWYVRFTCDGRDATTIYFDLHQRTLRYEVYFLPVPPGNHTELYTYLLRRNHTMYGARFSLSPQGDVYLMGRLRSSTSARSNSTASSACSTNSPRPGSSPSCAWPTGPGRRRDPEPLSSLATDCIISAPGSTGPGRARGAPPTARFGEVPGRRRSSSGPTAPP